jgi:hypothetical protein
MPTLNWIGKEAVVDHHRHVPTRLLECDAELSVGDADAENLLVEGEKSLAYYKYRDAKYEARGPYRLQPLATNNMDPRPNLRYSIPWQGEEIWPEKQWQWSRDRAMAALPGDELVIARKAGKWTVSYKQYLKDEEGAERRNEEAECATQIDRHPNVARWIRNTEHTTQGGFWLPKSPGKYFPDFIVEFKDGRIVLVEYKMGKMTSDPEEQRKKAVGELWAGRSAGRCRFAWIVDRDWHTLHAVLAS